MIALGWFFAISYLLFMMSVLAFGAALVYGMNTDVEKTVVFTCLSGILFLLGFLGIMLST